jgi:tetratricopeptide (TPR) repeat protein
VSRHLDRAMLLLEQSRHDLAEAELRQELAANPDNALGHALLSLCLARSARHDEATDEARAAIGLAPDLAYGHYAHALALYQRNRFDEAAEALAEAIRLDPEEADYFALLAHVRLAQRRWSAALEAAETGLQSDPEHVACTNARAEALVMLGRRDDAGATIDTALARDPENAWTHANMGWALLHRGEPTPAAEHFREALRLEPGNEWARQGIVEALKARNPLYGLMLRWFLWSGRLSRRQQWLILIGGYVGYRVLDGVTQSSPQLAPVVTPLLILYVVFALLTWTADALFNLTLRLSRFGRLVLTSEEIGASNLVGATLLVALASLVGWLVTGDGRLLRCALFFGALVAPIAAAFRCQPGWPRRTMAAISGVLAAIGLLGLANVLSGGGTGLISLGLIGAFAGMWVGNALIGVRPKR